MSNNVIYIHEWIANNRPELIDDGIVDCFFDEDDPQQLQAILEYVSALQAEVKQKFLINLEVNITDEEN